MSAFAEVESTFTRWLYLPDPDPLLALLGAYCANRVRGKAWLMIVGGSSRGKTEMLSALNSLPLIKTAGQFTGPAALLSGSPHDEYEKGAVGGLLPQLGNHGILLFKDLTSVLQLHEDKRKEVFAIFREAYDDDGATRDAGTSGGRRLEWKGHLGILAGVTNAIDSLHADSIHGERWMFIRLPSQDEKSRRSACTFALLQQDRRREMVPELAAAVAACVSSINFPSTPPPLDENTGPVLGAIADFATRARSPVKRDRHTREIEYEPDTEGAPRLFLALCHLYGGVRLLGEPPEAALRVVRRVALDSMPITRRHVLTGLAAAEQPVPVQSLSAGGAGQTSIRRALEELALFGLVEHPSQGAGRCAGLWALSDLARELLAETGIRLAVAA